MRYSKVLVPALLAGFITACGGDGAPAKNVSGTVSAINGEVAFYSPGMKDSMFAALFGKPLFAGVTGETSVGAGVTINLIEIDNAGAQVGDIMATTTTDADGEYILDAPPGFVADAKYVVRAVNSTGTSTVDARVDTLTPDIDSTSDAVSSVIAGNALDLGKLSTDEISEIHAAVADIVENTDSGATTVADFRSAIVTATADSEEASNLLFSTIASGQICGTIKDSSGAALENIRIVVRDFGNWVTRAKTKTDASGAYCVNVPKAGDANKYITGNTHTGEYILGALNFTNTSYAATQWWTSTSSTTDGTGGANSQFKAEKVTVSANTTTITKNMFLDKDGARVTGTVTGPSGASVEGMRVVIRNYDTFKPLASARVKADNTYRINVKATDYLLSFRNKTRHPYASEIYRSGTTGAFNRNMASRETMVANQDNTYDAELAAGAVISGIVKDNSGTAISGEVVYIDNADPSGTVSGGRIEALRTNKSGKFRIWVNPRLGSGLATPYTVRTRGQALAADTNGVDDNTKTHFKLSASPSTGLVFDAQTTKVFGKLVSADTTPLPVGSAVVFLTTSNSDKAVSAADGTFSLYTATPGITHYFSARMDDDVNYASGAKNGATVTRVARNTDVINASGGDVDLGDLTVDTLGVSTGVAYVKGNAGAGSTKVKFFTGTPSGATFMVATNSRGDGSFNVTVPAGNYFVRSDFGTGVCTNLAVANGTTYTLTYDATTCTVSP